MYFNSHIAELVFFRRYLLPVLLVLNLAACASYSQRMAGLNYLLAQNNPEAALALLQQQKPDANERVLYYLNMALLSQQLGDYEGSNHYFELAKKKAEALFGVSVSDQLQAMSLNDESIDYQGEHYELLFIHGFSALNYLALGKLDDARVEVLQAQENIKVWGEPEEGSGGYYWILYLSGVIYEKLGEYDNALISYRQLWALMKKKDSPVPAVLQQDLLRLAKKTQNQQDYTLWSKEFNQQALNNEKTDADLVVFVFNGLAPLKRTHHLPKFSHDAGKTVNIALPYYPQDNNTVDFATIDIAGKTGKTEILDSVDQLARLALADNMPAIITRALVRQGVKRNFVDEVDKRNNNLVGLIARVATMATEHADTRSWATLPHDIQITRLKLPAGQHRLSLSLYNNAGQVVSKRVFAKVTLKPQQIKVLPLFAVNPLDWSVSLR